ncbi:MAG: SDR family NAD(P)-dependent oxidoreductase, partial [Chloroflexota bacterium]
MTGGVGGLGLVLAQWLVDQGARHLVLISRQGPSDKAQETLAHLEALGVTVAEKQLDIANTDQVAGLFEAIADTLPPLRGIFHLAADLNDDLLARHDLARFAQVRAPKVEGAWNLHQLSLNVELDFFVLFSSMATLISEPGQGAYITASVFLDTLAHYRHTLGLPALTVNWGPWADVGHAITQPQLFERATQAGLSPMAHQSALAALSYLLHQQLPQAGVANINWHQLLQTTEASRLTLLSDFAQDDQAAIPIKSKALVTLPNSDTNSQEELVAFVQEQVANTLHINKEDLNVKQPINMMGLDSLMAIELRNKIQRSLNVTIPLTRFLDNLTILDAAEVIAEELKQTDGVPVTTVDSSVEITKANDAEGYDLSHGQQALWFEYQLAPDNPAYNLSFALHIHSSVDPFALQAAFQQLINRHAVFRTRFTAENGIPQQQVAPYRSVVIDQIEAQAWSLPELTEAVQTAHELPFDLEAGGLLRLQLFTHSPTDHILLVTTHHMVADGWSIWLLLEELQTLYDAIQSNTIATLPTLTTAYTDYVMWQTRLLDTEGDRLWHYWKQKLAEPLPVLNLPLDHPRPPVWSYRGGSQSVEIPPELTDQLRQLAKNEQTTLYTLLLAAFNVLLHRYTGQDDILLSTPTAGRTQPEFAELIGYFVSPVIIRADLSGTPTFQQFLQQIRQTVTEALDYQDYPFQLLTKQLQIKRDPSRPLLGQAGFELERPIL